MTATPTRARRIAVVGTAVAATALVLAGCSRSAAPSPSPTGAASGAANSGRGSVQDAGPHPGAAGVIAAITGTTLQVQSASAGQVAVTYSGATTFSQTVAVAKSVITKGSCVLAIGTAPTGSRSSAPDPALSPAARPTTFTAATITVGKAANGSCAIAGRSGAGGRGTGGSLPSGRNSPSGGNRPTSRPSGAASGARGFGGIADGAVTAVSADGIVVDSTGFGSQRLTSITVTIVSGTVISEQESATSAALAVGKCLTAIGTASSTGTVAATRIGVSTAGANGCASGGGRFRGGLGGGGFGGVGQGAAGASNGS